MLETENKHFFSQYGEDKILADIFKDKETGFFVEIGAFDGKFLSNSYYFELAGWKGILVEPIEELCQQMKEYRPNSKIINAAVGNCVEPKKVEFSFVTNAGVLSSINPTKEHLERIKTETDGKIEKRKVDLVSLNYILKDFSGDIDFISIDTEGNEIEVLKGFDLSKFKPGILIIEANDVKAGIQLKKYLQKYDYVPYIITECNRWFVHRTDSLVKHRKTYSKVNKININYHLEIKYFIKKITRLFYKG